MKKLVIAAALSGSAILLAGCSNQTVRDLEGVPISEPDKAEVVVNIDQFPNINRICIDGVAFATTTREAAGAIMRVPEWDGPWCGAAEK